MAQSRSKSQEFSTAEMMARLGDLIKQEESKLNSRLETLRKIAPISKESCKKIDESKQSMLNELNSLTTKEQLESFNEKLDKLLDTQIQLFKKQNARLQKYVEYAQSKNSKPANHPPKPGF